MKTSRLLNILDDEWHDLLMGREIPTSKFTKHDFSAFSRRLRAETELLGEYFRNRNFDHNHGVSGFEIEAWLVDKNAMPNPVNEEFLRQLDDPMVVHELASFNVEMNVDPQPLTGDALQKLHTGLSVVWGRCRDTARKMNADVMTIGIHPGVTDDDLTLEHMSRSKRYQALNEQILAMRKGIPLTLDIHGSEHLNTTHYDVMLEAATTSFQIHLQIRQEKAVRACNASQIASAPLVAVSANSPFIFGRSLWDESRIPLFQQSIDVGGKDFKRVTFRHDYVRGSLLSCFEENLEHYPVLIPILFHEESGYFPHLRFHNGTIWRWNRPLIGFDKEGVPHLRIENRVAPSGPTIVDMIANAAFYWGLVQSLTDLDEAPENQLAFPVVRQNFYNAGRYSLHAAIHWLDGQLYPVRGLLLDKLLPMAEGGLLQLRVNQDDCKKYLGIIEARIKTGQNGAAWQRRWVEKYGRDMKALSMAYLESQNTQVAVHEWNI